MSAALDSWSDFNVAMAGATAALAGLVIVAGSVNIAEIVKSRSLTARLGSAIVMLVVALTASAIGLMPEIGAPWYGGLVLTLAAIALVFQIMTTRVITVDAASNAARLRRPGLKAAVGYLPVAAYAAGGALALAGSPSALYVIALGCILAIIVAIVVSWVALVEVLR